jgi:hypothetical protein
MEVELAAGYAKVLLNQSPVTLQMLYSDPRVLCNIFCRI